MDDNFVTHRPEAARFRRCPLCGFPYFHMTIWEMNNCLTCEINKQDGEYDIDIVIKDK